MKSFEMVIWEIGREKGWEDMMTGQQQKPLNGSGHESELHPVSLVVNFQLHTCWSGDRLKDWFNNTDVLNVSLTLGIVLGARNAGTNKMFSVTFLKKLQNRVHDRSVNIEG